MDIVHTALWVSNLEEAKSFYEDIVGLNFQRSFEIDGVQNYFVGTQDGAELQLKYDPDQEGSIKPSGFDHFAMEVDAVDENFERIVRESGCEVVQEPVFVSEADARVALLSDPDGYTIELVNYHA